MKNIVLDRVQISDFRRIDAQKIKGWALIIQGGHCPGNQGNQGKVRESEKGLKVRESQGTKTGCPNVKVLPFLRFKLIVSFSTKIPHQEVREESRKS